MFVVRRAYRRMSAVARAGSSAGYSAAASAWTFCCESCGTLRWFKKALGARVGPCLAVRQRVVLIRASSTYRRNRPFWMSFAAC